MERGVIVSFDRGSGRGTISRAGNSEVQFSAEHILGRDRTSLKKGDNVWFELENIQNNNVAINIRKG